MLYPSLSTCRSLLNFGAFVAVLSLGSATCEQPAVRLARNIVSSSLDLKSIGGSAGAPRDTSASPPLRIDGIGAIGAIPCRRTPLAPVLQPGSPHGCNTQNV